VDAIINARDGFYRQYVSHTLKELLTVKRTDIPGVTDLDHVLKVRLANIMTDHDRAQSALDRIKGQLPAACIDSTKIERSGSRMRKNITPAAVPFRKVYLRWLIDAIDVDDRAIHIRSSKSTLEHTVIATSQTGQGVRSFVCPS